MVWECVRKTAMSHVYSYFHSPCEYLKITLKSLSRIVDPYLCDTHFVRS